MSNTQTKRPVKKAAAAKTYKFATIKREAQKAADARGQETPKPPPPFVIDDIEPPIVITAPDTVERQLMIAEMLGPAGIFQTANTLPMLRAFCGPAFPRVWALVKDDTDPNAVIGLLNALVEHFNEVLDTEAADLPGGSEASSS